MDNCSRKATRSPRLLVLGAGIYQMPVLRSARELGVEVIAVDRSSDAAGAVLADRFFAIDTTDREGVARLAIAERVDGVVAPCTDVAVPTQAHVAAAIGAVGPTIEAAETLMDKIRFRAYQARRGLPRARLNEVSGQTRERFLLPGCTYVLKPAQSSGSKGVFIVRSQREFEERLPETLRFSPDGRFLLESFVDGQQGTAEGLWIDGRVAFVVVTDRMTPSPPLVATLGHLWPSRLPEQHFREVLNAIADILADLAVPTTPFDCDFVVGADGPVILELTPRLGGNSLSKLVLAATGVDLPAEAVRLALPETAWLPPRSQVQPLVPAVGTRVLGSATDGPLTFDAAADAALRKEPWIAELTWDVPAGTPVRAFANGRDRVGEATVYAPDRATLESRWHYIGECLRIGVANA